MDDLAAALDEAGGVAAPREACARLRDLLARELDRGTAELARTRSGYERPVLVAFTGGRGCLHAVLPVPADVRADAAELGERAWLLTAAAVGALAEVAELRPPARAADLAVAGGDLGGHLVLAVPARDPDPELAVVAFEEHLGRVDRLKARAVALPAHVLDGVLGELRPPIGDAHPLRVAEAVARLGGRPARAGGPDELEDAVLAVLEPAGPAVRPHDDPDPARRVARRILQRLHGMGKWGGYHTEFTHLARGFRGNDRELAQEVGERLLAAGLLAEKPSVGQRHVFLNPRRAADIHALMDRGQDPPGLDLPG